MDAALPYGPGLEPARVCALRPGEPAAGRFVLYWMQAAQRCRQNPALAWAIHRANRLDRPLAVLFVLDPAYPEACEPHYRFLLEGLQETADDLRVRGIPLVLRLGTPPDVAAALAADAAEVVADCGYLRHQQAWRQQLAKACRCPVWQVEGEVVVPVAAASDKAEYGARTLRPKLHAQLDAYLQPLVEPVLKRNSLGLRLDSEDSHHGLRLLDRLEATPLPTRASLLPRGGTRQAQRVLDAFVCDGLKGYGDSRVDLLGHHGSRLSAYLHFGQISPVAVALAVRGARARLADRQAFLEQLIVRRELAINYVHYTPGYDTIAAIPAWAQATLAAHADERHSGLTRTDLDACRSDDPVWNAAMRQMQLSGYLPNYLRMYWGKQILAWTPSPAEALATILHLNNRYFLDGRDPNAYANIAWLFGVHDRGWPQQPRFGKVRSMTLAGLRRKADIPRYLDSVQHLAAHP